MHTLIQDIVNLNDYPKVDPALEHPQTFTIGDMHASIKKFFYFLCRHRISCLSEDNYQRLIKLLAAPAALLAMDKNSYVEFLILLKSPKIIDPDASAIIIGDDFSDREGFDLYMIETYGQLFEDQVNYDILLSNHGIEFILACERIIANETEEFIPRHIGDSKTTAASMWHLNTAIEKGLVTKQHVIDIYLKAYLPKVKLLDFQLMNDSKSINIFSHAPTGLNIIKALAEEMTVAYKDNSAGALADTIDRINRSFQKKYARTGKIHEIYRTDDDSALDSILWNRKYHHLERPRHKNAYSIYFINGHDYNDNLRNKNCFQLDNTLAKSSALSTGEYTVHIKNNFPYLNRKNKNIPNYVKPNSLARKQLLALVNLFPAIDRLALVSIIMSNKRGLVNINNLFQHLHNHGYLSGEMFNAILAGLKTHVEYRQLDLLLTDILWNKPEPDVFNNSLSLLLNCKAYIPKLISFQSLLHYGNVPITMENFCISINLCCKNLLDTQAINLLLENTAIIEEVIELIKIYEENDELEKDSVDFIMSHMELTAHLNDIYYYFVNSMTNIIKETISESDIDNHIKQLGQTILAVIEMLAMHGMIEKVHKKLGFTSAEMIRFTFALLSHIEINKEILEYILDNINATDVMCEKIDEHDDIENLSLIELETILKSAVEEKNKIDNDSSVDDAEYHSCNSSLNEDETAGAIASPPLNEFTLFSSHPQPISINADQESPRPAAPKLS